MRNAIDQINDSRLGDACTMSRYPNVALSNYHTGFSLWWIGWCGLLVVRGHRFVRRILPGVRAVLSFFESYQKKDGSLGPLPWCATSTGAGMASANRRRKPRIVGAYDLLTVARRIAGAELEAGRVCARSPRFISAGETTFAKRRSGSTGCRQSLYADTPAKQQFSQHTNTMAVLCDVITGTPARDLMLRTLTAPDWRRSVFFKFYMNLALVKVARARATWINGRLADMLARG